MKEIKENFKLSIEGVKKKLYTEVKTATKQLGKSYFKDAQTSDGGDSSQMMNTGTEIETLLSRKVDVQDFNQMLSTKPNKNEFIILQE